MISEKNTKSKKSKNYKLYAEGSYITTNNIKKWSKKMDQVYLQPIQLVEPGLAWLEDKPIGTNYFS